MGDLRKVIMTYEDTGEIFWKGNLKKFQTQEQYNQAKIKEDKISKNTPKFSNTNMDGIDFICSVLTRKEVGYLMLLQPYLDYEKGLIKSAKNKSPMSTKDIMDVLNVSSKSGFYSFRNKCLSNGILVYDKENKRHYINDKFMFKGAFNGMRAVSATQKEGKEEYTKLKPEDLYIIFKLQKFIHKNTMALVHNPEEDNHNKLKFMKLKEIADELGFTPPYVSRKLYELHINDQALVAKIKVHKEPARYMLNPRYFWRGSYEDIQNDLTIDVAAFFKINI